MGGLEFGIRKKMEVEGSKKKQNSVEIGKKFFWKNNLIKNPSRRFCRPLILTKKKKKNLSDRCIHHENNIIRFLKKIFLIKKRFLKIFKFFGLVGKLCVFVLGGRGFEPRHWKSF